MTVDIARAHNQRCAQWHTWAPTQNTTYNFGKGCHLRQKPSRCLEAAAKLEVLTAHTRSPHHNQ